jgi:putative transposase
VLELAFQKPIGDTDAPLMSQPRGAAGEHRRLSKTYADAQLSADLLRKAMSKKT